MKFNQDPQANTAGDPEDEPPIRDVRSPRDRPSDPPLSCEAYERLIRDLEVRTPTEEDFRRLAGHEADCRSGRHSEAGLEERLGLPRGALRHGSRAHGLESPEKLVARLVDDYLTTD